MGQTLAVTDDQRRLFSIARNLELLVEFISLKLSPDDYDYYLRNKGDFDAASWVRFLNEQCARFKLPQGVPQNVQIIEDIKPSLESFYNIARKRDDIFLNNTKIYMDAEGVKIAVLIAGGFHTPNLLKLFRDNNISYVVVAPKVVNPTDEKLYHKILTEGWAPAGGETPAME